MADISLLISVKTDDVVKSIKVINKLKTDANLVFKSLKKGTDSYTKGLSEVRKSLVATGMTSKQAYGQVKKLENAYARTKALEKSVKLQKRRAAALKETIAAERKAQVETKKLAAEVDRLSSKYKPLYAASKQYEKSLDEINRAQLVGAINTKQHSAAVESLNSDYQKFTSGTAGWDNQFVQGSNRAGKSMNKFGMYAQQVGYQVGDFFVQVQSGQSALVAFGQQGTQLAGLLPGVTGAVVGIGLAVGTMLLRSFMDASGEAKTMEEAITSAQEALESYKSAVTGSDTLKDDFGSMAAYMTKIADEAARFAENMLRSNLSQASNMLSIESTGWAGLGEQLLDAGKSLLSDPSQIISKLATGVMLSTAGQGKESSEGQNLANLGLSEKLTVDGFKSYTADVANALAGREYETAIDLMSDMYNDALSGMSDKAQLAMGTQGKEFVNSLKDQMDALAKFVKAQEDAVNAPRKAAFQRGKNFESEANNIRNEGLLSQTRQDFGEGSDTYKETLKQQTIAAYRDEQALLVKNKDLSQGLADVLVARFSTLQDILQAEETKKANDKAALDAAKEQEKLDKAATVAFLARGKAASQRVADTIKQLEVDRKIAAKEAETAKQLAYTVSLGKERAKLSEIELAGNKESTEYRDQEVILARMASVEASRRLGYSEETTATMEAQAVAQVTVTNQIADAATEAALLAKGLQEAATAMNSLSSFGAGLDKALAIAVAKTEALKAGSTGSIAGNIAGRRADLEARTQNARVMGADPALVDAAHKAQTTTINLLETELKLNEKLAAANKPKKEVKDNAYEKLRVEIDRRRDLLSLSKEQATSVRNLWSLQDALGKSSEKYSKDKLKAIVAEEIALKKLEEFAAEAVAKQEALSKSIESSIEDGFMKMIDGTTSVKDAFRSMAADIIKELYRVLVVQEMVEAAKTAMNARGGFLKMAAGFFMADGGAFSGGSQMKAYADGGVVGGPTTFGMSGGKTGLMGEAGPEAIMPLKRGANGKLGVQVEGGGGGDVININQSFNFQANGDDSVKKLIAQAAPKIAEMAKSSVVESRRRGGSTKAAFG